MYLYESNEKTVRWDTYFYELCKTVAKNSQCLSRRIGAVLVKDKTVLCAGYNGPPRGVQQCDKRWLTDPEIRKVADFENKTNGFTNIEDLYKMRLQGMCPRYVPEMGFKSGEGLDWCVAGHAERNALINAARMGIKTKNCHLYMDCGTPCTPCLVEIINAGIKEIIITGMNLYDKSSLYVLQQSDLKVRIYSTLCEHNNVLQRSGLSFQVVEGFCPDCGMQLT
jgi:dCMP deaminase